MQKAQDLAKNILNLSQSDLDEIMSADGESTKMVGIQDIVNLSRFMTKPTKWHVRPAKTQISLGIHPV